MQYQVIFLYGKLGKSDSKIPASITSLSQMLHIFYNFTRLLNRFKYLHGNLRHYGVAVFFKITPTALLGGTITQITIN
jgi:hypothetical protein